MVLDSNNNKSSYEVEHVIIGLTFECALKIIVKLSQAPILKQAIPLDILVIKGFEPINGFMDTDVYFPLPSDVIITAQTEFLVKIIPVSVL